MYTVRLKIDTSEYDERFFDKTFYFAWQISLMTAIHAQKALNTMNTMREYRVARQEYGRRYADKKLSDLKTEEQKAKYQVLVDTMQKYEKRFKLTRNDLEKFAKTARRQYSNYLSSQQGQWLADKVAFGVFKCLAGGGKRLHFKRFDQFDTIGQKSATNGIKLLGWYKIRFAKQTFRLEVPDTPYMQAVKEKHDELKTIALKRIEFNSGWRYYVILTFDGDPPVLHQKADGQNVTGIDLGTSTVAAESDNFISLENLAPDALAYEKKIRHLQNLVDHKIRMANPDNYDSLGRVRKGRHRWKISKAVIRLRRYIRVLYRKESAYVRCSHGRQINQLLEKSSAVVLEPMQFKKLQKKSKKTERQEKLSVVKKKDGSTIQVHKYKRKKRFGHSIKNRSPGLFQSELERKAKLVGIPFKQINTAKYKASQLHHDTGEYIKPGLQERYKVISGYTVQRDLYSAFLIRHSDDSLCQPDLEACNHDFQHFAEMQDALLSEMRANRVSNIPCWDF